MNSDTRQAVMPAPAPATSAGPPSFGDLQGSEAAAAAAAAALSSDSQQRRPQEQEPQGRTQLVAGTEGGEPQVLTLQHYTPQSAFARCAPTLAACKCVLQVLFTSAHALHTFAAHRAMLRAASGAAPALHSPHLAGAQPLLRFTARAPAAATRPPPAAASRPRRRPPRAAAAAARSAWNSSGLWSCAAPGARRAASTLPACRSRRSSSKSSSKSRRRRRRRARSRSRLLRQRPSCRPSRRRRRRSRRRRRQQPMESWPP